MTAIDAVRQRAPQFKPEIGVILGSGLAGFADCINQPSIVAYDEIDGFPVCTNKSHRGELVLGHVAGRAVACLNGRAHLYEGVDPARQAVPIRTLAGLGCRGLIVTNAAGSLDPDKPAGRMMLISDHINLQGANALAGPHDPAHGERFVPMNDAYDPHLRQIAHGAADRLGLAVDEGVYLAVLGPNFETPAEIRAFRTMGADAVGMSSVQEVITARQAGLNVLGVSLLTNMAAGLVDQPPSAEEVMKIAGVAASDVCRFLEAMIAAWPATG